MPRTRDVSDINWLDDEGDEFVCLQPGKDGSTNLCVGDASWGWVPGDGWAKRHYVAGTIDAAAGNLKVTKLDDEGEELGVVVSAQAGKNGSLFNAEKASKTRSTAQSV